MKVVILYQDDRSDADQAAQALSEIADSTRCERAADLLEGDANAGDADLLMVVAQTYREREAREVCERLCEDGSGLRDTPLLVAVNVYQMPLANRVKELPMSHFVFRPVDPADVKKRVRMLTDAPQE